MTVLSPVKEALEGCESWLFWCPGCQQAHRIVTRAPSGPVWKWNGSTERATFSPSYRVIPSEGVKGCHLFIEDGQLRFLSDCEHELAGKTVPMEAL